uniref:uncharacterized protein n=1 Tax=Pristiophorus japonicus TaxID=55135 RepID=UPI00398F14DA
MPRRENGWSGPGHRSKPEESENDQTEKPRQDTEVVHEISDPPKIYPGDYLFEVSIGVKFVGDNFKIFEGIEKRVERSIKNLVTEKLSTFSLSLKKLLLRGVERIDAPGLLFIHWLYFNPSGDDIYIPLQSQLNQLLNKSVANLRHGKAALFSISVADVDECSSGLSMCDPEANCLNAFGFYSCQCTKGFEDHSPTASGISCVKNVKSESGFGSSLGLQEILAGIILCVVLILAIILTLLFVMSKRRNKRVFDACNQSSDGLLPRPSLPQEEMRREGSIVFTACEAKSNSVFFTKFEPLEDMTGQKLNSTKFSTVQNQLSVETPHL